MIRDSPLVALGAHAPGVRDVVIEVVRSRHDKAAEAHQISGSRYAMGFASQWRDLQDDTYDALTGRGFQSHTLAPGGHRLAVVNNCLVYVWRVPDNPNAVKEFASSPTRLNGFSAPPPPTMLWEPSLTEERELVETVEMTETVEITPETAETANMLKVVRDTMPVVLVMVWSTPRQLQSIEWAVAILDGDEKVQLRGQESIWEPEVVVDNVTADVEAFDSGTPLAPVVELQTQDRPQTDA